MGLAHTQCAHSIPRSSHVSPPALLRPGPRTLTGMVAAMQSGDCVWGGSRGERAPDPGPLPALQHSPFFAEQLTAFQVWLTMGVENRSPPEQLPIVLQVSAPAPAVSRVALPGACEQGCGQSSLPCPCPCPCPQLGESVTRCAGCHRSSVYVCPCGAFLPGEVTEPPHTPPGHWYGL